jgi:hypothetical protein
MICLSLLILFGLFACAVLFSPKALRHAAARLVARAQALEAYEDAKLEALKHWRGVMGVAHEEGQPTAIDKVQELRRAR